MGDFFEKKSLKKLFLDVFTSWYKQKILWHLSMKIDIVFQALREALHTAF